MVERLREKADVTFAEAKAALDEANGDLLDALIILEREGKTVAPPKGGTYSDKAEEPAEEQGDKTADKGKEITFGDVMCRIGHAFMRILEVGNTNFVDAIYKGETKLACPVTVFIVLAIACFWAVIPLMILGIFLGWKFRLRGKELGREDINSALETAENAAETLKTSVTEKK